MPKVSIIVNCYNGQQYLKEALDSIYNQTEKNWEIIFFDNASTDKSASIALTYDNRLKYIKNDSTIPLGAARQQAVLYATGEWIAFLDTDDIWYPHKLSTQLLELENHDYLFCYAGIREVTSQGKIIREVKPLHSSGQLLESQLNQFEINMVTPMFHRDVIDKLGINFDPIITASEEYNLFVRLAAKGNGLVQTQLLGDYRVHDGSLTDRQISKWAYERRYTLEQLQQENPGIRKRYPLAFREAEARADYYEVRYLMSQGNVLQAKYVMKKIIWYNLKYFILYLILLSPSTWRFIHNKKSKSILSSFYEKIFLFKTRI